jgi:glycosyltransferase involved in cell wall biosynthesis
VHLVTQSRRTNPTVAICHTSGVRIALDATYSIGKALSGVGVYSREILNGLAASRFDASWQWFYRWHSYRLGLWVPKPRGVKTRLLSDTWGNRSADLFHGLNQRLPAKRFSSQIATFHDLFVLTGDYSTPEFRARFSQQAKGAAAASEILIAVSAFTASQIEEHLGIPQSRIRVIHHGVTKREIPRVERENIVLCVGAIQRRKNQAALVRAFRAMPEDWKLVLAGSPGFEARETMDAVAASPATKRIQVTGYVTDEQLSEWYGRASIFAFPSLDEGFGMPVLEAMQAGVPVIASNASAIPEVCGDAAELIDPRNEDQLADALVGLAKDEARRTKLIALGRHRAAEFSWEKAVRETLGVYKEVLRSQ